MEITAHYSRKTNPSPYNTAESSLFLKSTIGDEASTEDVVAERKILFSLCKSGVFEELGISWKYDEAGNVVEIDPVAQAAQALGPNTVVNPSPVDPYFPQPAPTPLQPPSPQPAPLPVPQPLAQPGAPTNSAGFPAGNLDPKQQYRAQWALQYVQNPGDWYDNRTSKRNPKGPDFSHKTQKDGQYKLGIWLTDFDNAGIPRPA